MELHAHDDLLFRIYFSESFIGGGGILLQWAFVAFLKELAFSCEDWLWVK